MFAIRRPRASCNVPRVIQIVDRSRVGRRIRRRRDGLRVSDLAIIRRRRAADVDKQNYSRENSQRPHGKPPWFWIQEFERTEKKANHAAPAGATTLRKKRRSLKQVLRGLRAR